MNENKEIPVLDFYELVNYIQSETKLDRETIETVLNMETDFMMHLGIITECEDKNFAE